MGSNPISASLDIFVFFSVDWIVDRDPRGGHNRKRVNEDFFKTWSPGMAYVLGFIYADGALEDCRASSRTCYLQLTNTDRRLLLKIRGLMQSDHRLYFRQPKLSKFQNGSYYCKGIYNLRIGSKVMFQDLLKYGICPRKSLVINLPVVPIKLFSYFLRGYFDGDGCVTVYTRRNGGKTFQVIFTSGSWIFLDRLSKRICELTDLGIKSASYQGGAFRLRYKAREALVVCNFMYRELDVVPYLKKKYEIYNNFFNSRSGLNNLGH